MRRDKIAKLAVALEVTPTYLMGWESTADIPTERVPSKAESVQSSSVSAQCKEIIEVCNQLSPHNQKKVLAYSKNLLSTQQMEEDLLAIHAKTDVEQISEGVLHNLDIMNDDSKRKSKGDVIMLYPFMTLNDNTEIVHSESLQKEGKEQVQVRIEKPVYGGFHSASCWLPDYKWENIDGFSDEEIKYFQDYLASVAHIIMQLAREGGFEGGMDNASSF